MRSSVSGPTRLLLIFRRFDAHRFITAEFFVVVAFGACFAKSQSDTYWHLAAGRAMARSGQVLLTDVFSHTNFGARWANYEWLSQVVFYQVHSLGGMPLLTAMGALLAFGSCLLAWRLMTGSAEDRVLLMAAALPLISPGWSVRPQAFTMFLLMLVVHAVVRERVWVLPPVFLLWANLHAAVALGLVVLAADFVMAIVSGRPWARRVVTGALAFAATLVTPLGPSLWLEVWRSLNRSRVNQISEWMPPVFEARFAVFWVVAAVFAVLAVTRWRLLESHADRVLVAVSALLLVLAARTSRNVVPFALVAAPGMSRLLWRQGSLRTRASDSGAPWGGMARSAVFALSALAAVMVVQWHWTKVPARSDWDPVSSAAAAAISSCEPPIYNHYDAGGYLIWFVPGQPVFLDSRQDPYPPDLIRAQREARTPEALRALLRRYRIRCAALEPGSFESSALTGDGWAIRYRDARWVVMTPPPSGDSRRQPG